MRSQHIFNVTAMGTSMQLTAMSRSLWQLAILLETLMKTPCTNTRKCRRQVVIKE